jgi:NhaP-type Na+/H+ or K+/H+ antiporter
MAAEDKTNFGPRDRWLMFALLLGPSAWALHLNLSYILAPESCAQASKTILHAVTGGCVVIAVAAAAIAWRIRQTSEGEERSRWLADVAIVLALSMVLVILAQEIPNLMLRSCD